MLKCMVISFGLLIAEIKPTPKPAKNRPATKSGMAVAAVCKATPNIKTTVEAIKPSRRPIASATGAAVSAPKKVPAERIDTIVEDCEAVMLRSPELSLKPVENSRSQYFMARMPPIVPVSYLFGTLISVRSVEGSCTVELPKQNTTKCYEKTNRYSRP
jgi:tetrahydromethanopterin S-methyltransferase subunit F